MARIFAVVGMLAVMVVLTGCAGMSSSGKVFSAQAMSFNILTFQIPGDPMVMATQKVPAGAIVQNVSCMPQDLDSIQGWVNRILGVGCCEIGGTIIPSVNTKE